jgi:hypothetical protein
MTIREFNKQLAGEQDLLLGEGKVQQARQNATHTIDKINQPKWVATITDLKEVDRTKFPRACVGSHDTLYYWDPECVLDPDEEAVVGVIGVWQGRWRLIGSTIPVVPVGTDRTSLDDRVVIENDNGTMRLPDGLKTSEYHDLNNKVLVTSAMRPSITVDTVAAMTAISSSLLATDQVVITKDTGCSFKWDGAAWIPLGVGSVKTIKDLPTSGINNQTIEVLGYHTVRDGGGGTFIWGAGGTHNGGTIIDPDAPFPAVWDSTEASQTAIANWFAYSGSGETWKRNYSGAVNVRWFGAKGNNTTPDTFPFTRIISLANTSAKGIGNGNSNRTGQLAIYIPAGQYLITDSIITSSDFSWGRTAGLVFKGDGPYITSIIYTPSSTNPLFYNNDKVLFLRFEGIYFYGIATTNTTLFYSVSSGGAHDYRFNDCAFSGNWQYIFHLTGDNTNSEYSFEKCSMFGSWNSFLYSATNDQFLNYWFTECKYWSSSNWCRFPKGGNIKISNCDVSGYQPSSDTYLFELQGATHAYGVCSFVCHATRFELKTVHAKVLYCAWGQGNILFSGCDMESQTGQVSLFNTVFFQLSNVAGPVIQWINCSLMGTHTYNGASNSFEYTARISYDNCLFTQVSTPSAFLIRTTSVNSGGVVNVRMYNCRGASTPSAHQLFDTDQGWAGNSRGITSRKIVRIGAANTSSPISGGSETVQLPPGSVITKVWLYNPAGSTANSGPYHFAIRTDESTPTVLGQVTGSTLSSGFNVANDLFFIANSAERRKIKVIDLQNITNTGTNYFLIEYIG